MTNSRPSAKRITTPALSRRALLGSVVAASAAAAFPGRAYAFGDEGAFNPRILLAGTAKWAGQRKEAPARWALEVVGRTSAPARLSPTAVRADAPDLLEEPFAVWAGSRRPEPLTKSELGGLRRFIALGGVLLVDELDPDSGEFAAGAEREIARALPDGSAIDIGEDNVIFRSFYLLRRATGRVQKADKLRAIVRGGAVQVIFSPNDLLGALARGSAGVHPFDVVPGGEQQRERAVRLAVNIAMYVLCSNYKDDQVHAPFLMRRRASTAP
jgi:hypothetical protein